MAQRKSQSGKSHPAGWFLLAIVVIIVLILLAGVFFTINQQKLMKVAFVPGHEIGEENLDTPPDYSDKNFWLNVEPAYSAKGVSEAESTPGQVNSGQVNPGKTKIDIFYIHPTTYLSRASWNAPWQDPDTENRLKSMIHNQASVFAPLGQIYSPRYRQATLGAFLGSGISGRKALINAYRDILAAFDYYMAHVNEGRPFILAGHSQGSLHALYLLKQRIAGTTLTEKMVAAYLVGWPVSMEADIQALDGITACQGDHDTGCIVSYQTFGPEGDPGVLLDAFNAAPGLDGTNKAGTKMLCTNPLNWRIDGTDTRQAHLGAVALTNHASPLPAPIAKFAGAACSPDGVLLLDREPNSHWQEFMMSGQNYHAYDYNLFYMNLQAGARHRVMAWTKLNIPKKMM